MMDGTFSRFEDRRDAGRQLAACILQRHYRHPVILALPRGGMPVAYEVALALRAPLDLLLVRKIGAPHFPELAIGAVVEGCPAQRVTNRTLIAQLGVPEDYLEAESRHQLEEIERRRTFYGAGRMATDTKGRTVIIVDDGIATGSTMEAALQGVRRQGADSIVLAVPVASPSSLERLAVHATETVCLLAPDGFRAVGQYYLDFAQTADEEVIALLNQARIDATHHTRST